MCFSGNSDGILRAGAPKITSKKRKSELTEDGEIYGKCILCVGMILSVCDHSLYYNLYIVIGKLAFV